MGIGQAALPPLPGDEEAGAAEAWVGVRVTILLKIPMGALMNEAVYPGELTYGATLGGFDGLKAPEGET